MLSALTLAFRCKDLRNAELLLNQGADIHHAYKDHISLLSEATSSGNSQAVKLLLDAGADVNAVGPSGRSALSLLGLDRNYDITIARILLSAGADPSLVDSQGKTALQLLCGRFDDRFDAPDVPAYPTRGVDGINLLLSGVADIYELGYYALQIMRISAVNGWSEVVTRLLRRNTQSTLSTVLAPRRYKELHLTDSR